MSIRGRQDNKRKLRSNHNVKPSESPDLSDLSSDGTLSVPTTPMPLTPNSENSEQYISPTLTSPSRSPGFIKLDTILNIQQDRENLENSSMAIAALTALSKPETLHDESSYSRVLALLGSPARTTSDLDEEAVAVVSRISNRLRVRYVTSPAKTRRRNALKSK